MLQISPPPALSQRERGISQVPCEFGAPSDPGEGEGPTYYCGVFTAPMRWEDPDSPNIDLHFIVLKATGEDPHPDPLVYLAGGPGQGAVTTDASHYAGVRETRDIVRLDQRGAGLSQRLGLEECLGLALQDPEAGEELDTVIQFIQANSGEAAPGSAPSNLDFNVKVRQLCSQEFASAGIDLNTFTSVESARDLAVLIRELGYDAFNIHGVSYGTRLAMTLMALLPEMEDAPALRSVVLDSSLPPSVYLLSSFPRNRHDPVLQLLDECQQDEACRAAYPNLAARLGALLAQLEAEPLTVDGETITVSDVVAVLSDLNNTRSGYIPMMIADLEQSMAETYRGLRDKTLGGDPPEGADSLDRSDPVQAFIADGLDLLGAEGELGPVLEFMAGVGSLLAEDDPLTALQGYINDNYEGTLRDKLRELLAQVTPQDLEKSSYVAQLRAQLVAAQAEEPAQEEDAEEQVRTQRTLSLVSPAYFLNMNIHCNEDFQFERYEDGLNTVNDLPFPQLADLDFLREQSNTLSLIHI
jgi:pimeloyl-ACP methyl ester carboxylesterase